jgi:myosin protein heavy chain
LAAIAGSASDNGCGQPEEVLRQAMVLLEALGNAKTTKNDSSSRFGKFIKINFGNLGTISGASIQTYLLETSRVTHQEDGEHNFHIFYQLLAGFPVKEALGLSENEKYNYISDNSAYTVKSIDDKHGFEETLAALSALGFSTEEKDLLFAVVAAILNLGNVTFEGDESSQVVDVAAINKAGELLKIPPAEIVRALCSPLVSIGASGHVPVASLSRDALCCALYGSLFSWVVHRINKILTAPSPSFIGILENVSFENSRNNSFDQLCRNYFNERIERFYESQMFELEQKEYKAELPSWAPIDFGTSSTYHVKDLIEKIFSSLTNVVVPAGDPDKDFTSNISNQFGGHPNFFRNSDAGDFKFSLRHYAGMVTYDTHGWIRKNLNYLTADLQRVVCASGNKILGKLFSHFRLPVISSLTQQATSLVDTLQSTQPHFVRCILPNTKKQARSFDDAFVIKQINDFKIIEGIRIFKEGYPDRMPYSDFVKWYGIYGNTNSELSDRSNSENMMNKFVDGDDFLLGETKIFFRKVQHPSIFKIQQKMKETEPVKSFSIVQAIARAYAARKSVRKLMVAREAGKLIAESVREWFSFRECPWRKLFLNMKPLHFGISQKKDGKGRWGEKGEVSGGKRGRKRDMEERGWRERLFTFLLAQPFPLSMLQAQDDLDFEIRCSDGTVRLHQCVLWSRAPKFLEYPKIEASAHTFSKLVVPFIYENTFVANEITFPELIEVLKISKAKRIPELLYLAQSCLLKSFSAGYSLHPLPPSALPLATLPPSYSLIR